MNLIITRSFPPSIGGMQNLMWGLSNALSKLDMIKVYADFEDNHNDFDDNVSFSIERVGGAKIFRKYRKAYLINSYLKSKNNVRNIIADHWKSLEHIKTNKHKICLIHSKEINYKNNTRMNQRVLKVLNNVKIVVANSNFTKELAIEKGVNKDLITIINPGVNILDDIQSKNIKKAQDLLINRTPRLITVSRFDRRKNHAKVIMAVRNLKQIYPRIIYVCVGYGEEEARLRRLSRELMVEDHVIFLNNISQDFKNALLSKSDIFLMPSIIHEKSVEGFGISFIEAASYGKGSIGGVAGGESDAIKNSETGYLCNGNDLNAIYNKIINFFENDNYKTFGKNALEFSKNFKWRNIIKKYIELI